MSQKKRPMVYISADPRDARDCLYTLNRVVLQLGGVPVSSYYHNGAGEYDWPLVRQTIDECDIYVLLVADNYGDISDTGESYIHREAVYAKSKDKTVVALLKNAQLTTLYPQDVQRLKSLHRLMMSGTFKYWNGKEEMLLVARQVLRNYLKPQLGISSAEKNELAPVLQEAFTDTLFEMDAYPMHFNGKVYAHGNCHEISCAIDLTWQTAFLNLGAMMTAPVTEDRMRSFMESYVEDRYRGVFLAQVEDAHALADVRCNDIEFQRLKAFLKGAGVIENVAREQGALRNYWQLTKRGEHRLNRLLLPTEPV